MSKKHNNDEFDLNLSKSKKEEKEDKKEKDVEIEEEEVEEEEVEEEPVEEIEEEIDVSEDEEEEDTKEEEKEEEQFEVVESKEDKYEEVETKKVKRTDSYYDASLIELIGYGLLNWIITVFTLGIARPWGECMITRYIVNHTTINGKRLEFEGKGSAYFVQIFKWVLLSIITLGIYTLWIPIKKLRWQISQIHFEDENLVTGDSYFEGSFLGLVGINILCFFITFFTLGILYPVAHCFKMRWICKHTIINKKRLIFKGKAMSFFLNNLLWIFLTIITFGIFGLWLGIFRMKWQVKNTSIKLKDEEEEKEITSIIIAAIITIIVIIVGVIVITNAVPAIEKSLTPDETILDEMRVTYKAIDTNISDRIFNEEEYNIIELGEDQARIREILNINELNEFVNNGGTTDIYGTVAKSAETYYTNLIVNLTKEGTTCRYYTRKHTYEDEHKYMSCKVDNKLTKFIEGISRGNSSRDGDSYPLDKEEENTNE